MKIVTDNSTISPIVKSLDPDARSMIRFDRNLLTKLDAEVILVRDYGLAAAESLSGSNEFEFAQRLKHFKLALKSYFKKVGAKLYVVLRHELKEDTRVKSFTAFESQTRKELSEIAILLIKAKNMDWSEKETKKSEFSLILSLVMKTYEQEKGFLYPIYSELSQKYAV